jgi:hypothetical protein
MITGGSDGLAFPGFPPVNALTAESVAGVIVLDAVALAPGDAPPLDDELDDELDDDEPPLDADEPPLDDDFELLLPHAAIATAATRHAQSARLLRQRFIDHLSSGQPVDIQRFRFRPWTAFSEPQPGRTAGGR